MTNDERREIYKRWLSLTEDAKRLEEEKKTAKANGDRVFDELRATDVELAYDRADEAGWVLCDELDEKIETLMEEAKRHYKTLKDNQFDLNDFQSCCAYGLDIKKQVKVTFLDGREGKGLIYPLVYDNPQEMMLVTDSDEIFLDEGWEVYNVSFV